MQPKRCRAAHILTSRVSLIVEVIAPDSDVFQMESAQLPDSLVASTSVTGAIFHDVRGLTSNSSLGSFRPPTRIYRAGAVVVGAPIDRLQSDKLRSVTAFFPGISAWAGMSAAEEARKENETGGLQSWSVKLESGADEIASLPGGRELKLSTHWSVDGPYDRRVIYAPISMTVSNKDPAHWAEFMQPLLAFQGLISMAHTGLVLADGGLAELDLQKDAPRGQNPTWWTARLMRQDPGARLPKSMNEFPSFYLDTVGGIEGVRRWVQLAKRYPRAVGPVIAMHRYGPAAAETRLLEVAAAMEYWVGVHRHTTAWAKKGTHESIAHAMATRGGSAFAAWVKDSQKWAETFWAMYNTLKHNPNGTYDVLDVHRLAESGMRLLQCVLLNRVAGTVTPARSICSSHQNYELGRQVAEQIG